MTPLPPSAESTALRKRIIVYAPSGTLASFRDEYGLLDRETRRAFPSAEIIWTYASDSIRKRLPAEERERLAPGHVFDRLQNVKPVVGIVQSLHIIQGGEFGRLAREASVLPVGWTISGPLIRDEADFNDIIGFIRELRAQHPSVDCLMLVGHGAKAPHGVIYEKLAERIREEFGRAVLFGSLTGRPERSEIMRMVEDERFKTVRLVPFLFSVGWHAQNDIIDGERSWRRDLEARGVIVSVTPHGLSRYPTIARMVLNRLRRSLEGNPEETV